VTADASATFPLGDSGVNLGLSMSNTNSFSVTSTSGSEETISKSLTNGLIAFASMTDGIDHGLDQFQLLLNPAIVLTHDCVKYGNGTGWNMGFRPPAMVMQEVTACQILNNCSPASPIPAGVTSAHLTDSDYCSILSQDPFVAHCQDGQHLSSLTPPATPVDPEAAYPGRFRATTWEPPYNLPVGGGGCTVRPVSISNSFDGSNTSQSQAETSSTASLGVSISVPDAASFGLTSTDSLTFTHTVSNVNTSGTSQTATAAVACPGTSWNNAYNQILIYWDNIYSSFLFYPMDFTGLIHHGNVTDASGHALVNLPVELSYGGKTYYTATGNRGDYKIYSSAIKADPQHPLPAKVSVGGVTINVTLGSAAATAVRLPGRHILSNQVGPQKSQ
jgi:hypothetical protein